MAQMGVWQLWVLLSAEAESSNTAVEDKHDIAVHGQIVVADIAEMAWDLAGVEEVAPAQT